MRKKDYELIAGVMQFHIGFESDKDFFGDWTADYSTGFVDGLKRSCEILAEVLEEDNPKFDRQRFLTLCGIEEDLCPKYGEPVLPDEKGNCSLCGLHQA